MTTSINNKEYLKKYLSLGKAPGEKKKKKKKPKVLSTGLKIIDVDISTNISEEIQQDLDTEDAPQIVSVIDDRPPSLRVEDDSRTKLWKPIGITDDAESSEKSIKLEGGFRLRKVQYQSSLQKSSFKNLSTHKKEKKSKDNDFSPPRIKIKQETPLDESRLRTYGKIQDYSPPRKIKEEVLSNSESDNDISPKKKQKSKDYSPPSRKNRNRSEENSPRRNKNKDISPPRRRNRDEDSSPPRRNKNEDISPPRRRNRGKSEDNSPPRKEKRDISPPRRARSRDRDNSPPRQRNRKSSEGSSPPRKGKTDISPVRNRDGDNSPPRRNNEDKHKDISPPKRRRMSEDISPPRKTQRDHSSSGSRKDRDVSPSRVKKSRWGSESEKMTKTLEGKTAGLQNAMDLAKETAEIRRKNEEIFKNMSGETSGKNATTIVRNTVRNKHKQVDPEEEERKRIREEQNKEKYDRWGKGIKQVEAQTSKIEDIVHEMSKPLARYADDKDLEKYLKDQEREGDPMLAYMRKKKRKTDVESGTLIKPQFQGEFPPNRFGIPPGYRWDGVNRSNGYEKKYFEVQNKKKADVEEAYKWSTEDM